jgi:hypothetical protein
VYDLGVAISYSVDCNKTGKIPQFTVEKCYEKWDAPEFMASEGKKFYNSESILGKLYLETDKFSFIQSFLNMDFDVSLCRKYTLHKSIIALAPDKQVMHALLEGIQRKIIFPFHR